MSAQKPKTKKATVLVVDDDVAMRLLLRESLNQAGFEVIDVGDGKEAVDQFRASPPDVVMLDVEMPGMDGFTACEQMRKLPEADTVPIIMVTGRDDHDSVNRAYESGATDFIIKPINWTVLGHHVRYVLRASESYKALQRSEGRLKAILRAIPDVIFRMNRDGVYVDRETGEHAAAIVGHDDFIGKSPHDVMAEEHAVSTATNIQRAFHEQGAQIYEYELNTSGGTRHFEARLVASDDEEVLAIVRDISDRRDAEEKIRYLAYYDSLTGLPNRMHYEEHLGRALMQAKKCKERLAVMFLDLDRFKLINDTLGHNVGDSLLIAVGDRLKHSLRATDMIARATGEQSVARVARIGGDEFILLLSESTDPTVVARRILAELSQPFSIDGHEIFISPSIGIATYPEDGEEVETLVKNADAAMYHAKAEGRNNYKFYANSMNARSGERLSLENDLRRALDREEFVLHYQPQVDSKSVLVTGVEALIRWQHPVRGLVSPMEFIPIAEETGLILPIGDWVLHEACRQSRAWREAGVESMPVAVNISGRQFRHRNFLSDITQALSSTGLHPKFLELELTESILMQNARTSIRALQSLKEMGLTFSVDDFGTGYSSLSYLKRFPLDTLKVDRAFVRDIITDPNDAAIVTAIIAMAQRLNLMVVAEGVETEAQLRFLRKHGCDTIQGFYFSKPLPAEEILHFLAKLGQYEANSSAEIERAG